MSEDNMRDQTGLVKRGSIYYFRVRIPSDLLAHYEKDEVWKSLRTKDRGEARQRAKLEALKWDQEFSNVRSMLSPAPVSELSDLEIERLTLLYKAHALDDDEFIRADGRLLGNIGDLYGKALEKFAKEDAQRVARGVPKEGWGEMDTFLAGHGIRLTPGTEHYRKVSYAFAKASKQISDAMLARQAGEVVDTPKAEPFVIRTSAPANVEDTLEALKAYWEKQGEKAPRTIQEAGKSIQLLQALNPGLPASKFEKRHIVAFKDKRLADGKSAATVQKEVNLLKAIFGAAVDNDKLQSNPAQGIKVPKPKLTQKARVPFSVEDLKAIFSSEVFTKGSRPKGGAGDAAYWIPLIGLWTGARLEEIGQLMVEDIREEQGVHYFIIMDDPDSGKRVKTQTSRRRVPLHQELIQCGFLDYVASLRKTGQKRLFPLVESGEGRQKTASFSQWWGRYLRGVVKVSDRKKVFHSFRHGFKDACRDSDISKEIHDRLTGHGTGDIGDGYGGEHFPMGPLADAMKRLQYRELDLSRLHK